MDLTGFRKVFEGYPINTDTGSQSNFIGKDRPSVEQASELPYSQVQELLLLSNIEDISYRLSVIFKVTVTERERERRFRG